MKFDRDIYQGGKYFHRSCDHTIHPGRESTCQTCLREWGLHESFLSGSQEADPALDRCGLPIPGDKAVESHGASLPEFILALGIAAVLGFASGLLFCGALRI